MASTIPYTYFQCPCTSDTPDLTRKDGDIASLPEEETDDRDFDPRSPRANYSLYPLEHLLYCEDCQQIRCPRCVLDEIVTWYCPNCLFEVPSSTVRSEGNSLESPPTGLGAEYAAATGPWVLTCSYCRWSSKEIGIQFDKPNAIYTQLSKVRNGGRPVAPTKERRQDRDDGRIPSMPLISGEDEDHSQDRLDEVLDPETQFANLKSFYQSQLAETSPTGPLSFSGDYGYGSPGTLSRIMGLYTGGSFPSKSTKNKKSFMREAQNASEGLVVCPAKDNRVEQLEVGGWAGTASREQRFEQSGDPRFVSELRPVPYLLRTKRSKRCKTCRHILTKPESKVQTTRFRIRLVALNYLPSMSVRMLSPSQPPSTTNPAVAPTPDPTILTPLKPTQFLLTLKNPLFDAIKVTLATPSHTPGRFGSKITILCPQFEVGANTDVWDEALQEGSKQERRRTAKEAGEGQAEAGKVWERGRNWVSIVMEVVPASLSSGADLGASGTGLETAGNSRSGTSADRRELEIYEDEDILEIPVFVRVEWETDAPQEDAAAATTTASKDRDAKEKRELAYWCVLGVGRIVAA
ncbi:MAG: hypothetical protein M1818_004648 [Claussenomyces sp. TS43310]|nr:MAG: hypothetical protein M1818_004648 [Claussenomyces sp. TS43310]